MSASGFDIVRCSGSRWSSGQADIAALQFSRHGALQFFCGVGVGCAFAYTNLSGRTDPAPLADDVDRAKDRWHDVERIEPAHILRGVGAG